MSTSSVHSVYATNKEARYGRSYSKPYSGPENYICKSELNVRKLKNMYPGIGLYPIRIINRSGAFSDDELHMVLSKAQREIKTGTFSDSELIYFAVNIALNHNVQLNRVFIGHAVNGVSLSDIVKNHKSEKNNGGVTKVIQRISNGYYN